MTVEKACVLVSGGLDSIAALHWARATYPGERRDDVALSFGITVGQVNRALDRARAAVQEARQRAASVR